MKITWLVNNITQVGGIEQVICGLSNYLVQALGHDVEIVSVNTFDGTPYFNINPDIRIHHCGLDWRNQTRGILDRTVASVIKTLDADFLITCHSPISICALRHRKLFTGKIIVTQHCAFDFETWKRRLVNALFYRFADAFVVLTGRDQKFYRKLGCYPIVIPNAIYGKIGQRSSLNEKILISVGRLTGVKGFDMLIQAFSMVACKYPDWKLCICGDGEDAEKLKELASSLGLLDQIYFPGYVDVSEYMSDASGFVLSSRSEGFSLALVEAMAHGLPVVAYALPPAIEICGEKYPLLVPCEDVAKLAEKIDILLASDHLRHELSSQMYQRAGQFAIPVVAEQWDMLFSRLANTGGK